MLFILSTVACLYGKSQYSTDYYPLLPIEQTSYSSQVFLGLENDIFLQTDYYFTNGAYMGVMSDDLNIPKLSSFLNTPFTLKNKSYGISFRQNMYTPEKMFESEIQRNDRPYAGYFIVDYKLTSENKNRRFTSSLTLGILGKHSLAGITQNFIHGFEDMTQAGGWEYQVSNAPIINLNYLHEQKIIQNQVFDFQYALAGRLGSLYTDASASTTLRIGKRNSTFNFSSKIDRMNNFECYVFFSAGVRVSYYDATLQGSILVYNPSQHYFNNIDRELVIGSLSGGLVIAYDRFRLRSSITKISPEFKGGKSHGWGEVSIAIAF